MDLTAALSCMLDKVLLAFMATVAVERLGTFMELGRNLGGKFQVFGGGMGKKKGDPRAKIKSVNRVLR